MKLPLASGLAGAALLLALAMVVSLLTSLELAISLAPSLASWFVRKQARKEADEHGPVLKRVARLYEWAVRLSLRHAWIALIACAIIGVIGAQICRHLETDFLPDFDEGGFVIDCLAPPGAAWARNSAGTSRNQTAAIFLSN